MNKYIAHQNVASRREADKLIEKGMVLVNGLVETNFSRQIIDSDKVEYLFDKEADRKVLVSIKLNKPSGYVVSKNAKEGMPIYKLIENMKYKDLYPVGRLDKDSVGLIILTNNGVLAKKIISIDSVCEKEYYVKVDVGIPDSVIKKLEYGMSLDGKKLKPAKVRRIDSNSFYITLTEGRNRQIRRMCKKVGCEIIMLKRIRIANIKLDGLKEGSWEYLTDLEISSI